jgi:acetolactate synthase-1/3 small subunit
MTLTLHGDDVAVEQATKQLYRLIDVLKVQDVTLDQLVEHELALIKVRATDANRGEVIKIVEMDKGAIVDISAESVIVEAHGTELEIDALVALLRSYGIKELVRTGATVMLRGAGSIEEANLGRMASGAAASESPDRGPGGASPRSSEGGEDDAAEVTESPAGGMIP